MENVINDFLKYIQKNGGRLSEWYVGIAKDPKKRLFNDHNVNQVKDQWIHTTNPCLNTDIARQIERRLLNYGLDGGTSGGDITTRYIYAYKKTCFTIE